MWTFNWRRYLKEDSSAKDISHETPETSSTIRTETVTGSHLFEVLGYSLTKGFGIGKELHSDVFTVGGYNWRICFYPEGRTSKKFVSFLLELISDASDVKAKVTFAVLQQNGIPSYMSRTSAVNTFKSTSANNNSSSWGYDKFAKRNKLKASKYLKDDAFTVKCTIVVFQETKLKKTNLSGGGGIIIPCSNLNWHMSCLLDSGDGADVTFVVKGEIVKAHRWMLAARSAVFKAELFGGMKENRTNVITIEDMEVEVFKSMLYYIYADLLPDFKGTNQDVMFMAQHLLVAADRYALERMRLLCEDLLANNLDVNTVATTIILAEQHNCSQLKEECLKFMSSPEVFKVVALTDGFQNLMNVCPSVLKDIALHLKS